MKNYQRVRTANVVKQMWDIFQQHKPPRGKKPLLDALWFYQQFKGCRRTITKARKALGVKSEKIAGRFIWRFPTRTLEQALDRIKGESGSSLYKAKYNLDPEREKIIIQDYIDHIIEILRTSNYELSALQIRKELKGQKMYQSKWRHQARREAGIKKFLVKDSSGTHWNWVYGGEEVQQWLDTLLLAGGEIKESEIYNLALAKGWSERVVGDARHRLGGIGTTSNGCWYNRDRGRETTFEVL